MFKNFEDQLTTIPEHGYVIYEGPQLVLIQQLKHFDDVLNAIGTETLSLHLTLPSSTFAVHQCNCCPDPSQPCAHEFARMCSTILHCDGKTSHSSQDFSAEKLILAQKLGYGAQIWKMQVHHEFLHTVYMEYLSKISDAIIWLDAHWNGERPIPQDSIPQIAHIEEATLLEVQRRYMKLETVFSLMSEPLFRTMG